MPDPGGINQQQISRNVDKVHHQPHTHGGLAVPHRPEQISEKQYGRPSQHGGIHHKKILAGQLLNGRVSPHPNRHPGAQRQSQHRKTDAYGQSNQHRLSRRSLGSVPVSRSAGLGNIGQEAYADSGDRAVDEPVDGGGGPNRGGGVGAQSAYHSRIDILNRRCQELLQHGGQSQG